MEKVFILSLSLSIPFHALRILRKSIWESIVLHQIERIWRIVDFFIVSMSSPKTTFLQSSCELSYVETSCLWIRCFIRVEWTIGFVDFRFFFKCIYFLILSLRNQPKFLVELLNQRLILTRIPSRSVDQMVIVYKCIFYWLTTWVHLGCIKIEIFGICGTESNIFRGKRLIKMREIWFRLCFLTGINEDILSHIESYSFLGLYSLNNIDHCFWLSRLTEK
jgi:hypothetical protein